MGHSWIYPVEIGYIVSAVLVYLIFVLDFILLIIWLKKLHKK